MAMGEKKYTVGIRTKLSKEDSSINPYQHMTLAYLGRLGQRELNKVKKSIKYFIFLQEKILRIRSS